CLSAKRTTWNEFNCSMAFDVICLATVDDMTSHNTRYTSFALTQKVFANMRRVGKGFSGVETPLFALMLVQPLPQAEEEVKEPNAPAPPSPTNAPSPALQDPTLTPHDTLHALPPQKQPSLPYDSTMPLLTTLMEPCASLSQKVAELEQDKHTQALEILKLKNRVLRRMHLNRGKIEAIDADKDIILVDMKKDEEVVTMDVEPQGRINQEKVNAVSKGVSAAEPTVFDDEENMAGYKMEHFKGMTYDKVRPIFERKYKKVQTLFKLYKDVEEPKKKRVADETILQESFKELRAA
nr:hypothetical protein [Tanacetum cinerariifolium]